jgi:hypothetical protein
MSEEYAAVGDQLPFLGGRPQAEIETVLKTYGLVNVGGDPLLDRVTAQAQRRVEEGRERLTHRRYVVWGDVARMPQDRQGPRPDDFAVAPAAGGSVIE